VEAIIIEPLAKITKQEKAGGPPEEQWKNDCLPVVPLSNLPAFHDGSHYISAGIRIHLSLSPLTS
jgi:hypothetical protein